MLKSLRFKVILLKENVRHRTVRKQLSNSKQKTWTLDKNDLFKTSDCKVVKTCEIVSNCYNCDKVIKAW